MLCLAEGHGAVAFAAQKEPDPHSKTETKSFMGPLRADTVAPDEEGGNASLRQSRIGVLASPHKAL